MRSHSWRAGFGGGVVLLALCGPADSAAFSGGPPDERTGAPDELTCADGCHTSFALNSGPGSVVIDAPSEYEAGMTYAIDVSVTQTGQMRWGFELTVLDAEGAGAGELAPIDANTQTSFSPNLGREYVKHTSAGTMLGQADGNTFHFEWTAPPNAVGPLTFFAAGNAANGDTTNQGDYIYTASIQVPEPTALATGLALLTALGATARIRRNGRVDRKAAAAA